MEEMTPKEKAKSLIDFFRPIVYPYIGSDFMTGTESESLILKNSKECANRCVDEILKNFEGLLKPEYSAFDAIGDRKFIFNSEDRTHMTGYDMKGYWESVKREIEYTK